MTYMGYNADVRIGLAGYYEAKEEAFRKAEEDKVSK